MSYLEMETTVTSTTLTTYDIQFILGSSALADVFRFDEYRHAKQTLRKIGKEMKVPVANKVASKMDVNRKSRRR